MAAGQGFKTFATGDVLTAADTNGYLMQGIWVFANAAARTAAVTSPQEGNMSYLKDTNSTEYYSGSAWVAVSGGSAGLVLINTTSFSASSAVNIDSVFSSTYTNYRIVSRLTTSVNDTYGIRLRASGSTDSSALYYLNGTLGVLNSISAGSTESQTRWRVGGGSITAGALSVDVYSPNTGVYVQINSVSSGVCAGTAATHYEVGGFLDKNFTADGFALVPNSGTLSGTVSVYGYVK
jgi:hypothetical protein